MIQYLFICSLFLFFQYGNHAHHTTDGARATHPNATAGLYSGRDCWRWQYEIVRVRQHRLPFAGSPLVQTWRVDRDGRTTDRSSGKEGFMWRVLTRFQIHSPLGHYSIHLVCFYLLLSGVYNNWIVFPYAHIVSSLVKILYFSVSISYCLTQ